MKRGSPDRDWGDAIAKCRDEGECRVCHVQRGLECAHTIGRKHDQPKKFGAKRLYVNPVSVIPLCSHCHGQFDRHEIGILEVLTPEEQIYAVERLGTIEAARVQLDPVDYHRVIMEARMAVREAA